MLVFWNILLLTKTTYQNIQLLFKSFNYSHKLLDYDQLRSLVHLIMIFYRWKQQNFVLCFDERNEISRKYENTENLFREKTNETKFRFAETRTVFVSFAKLLRNKSYFSFRTKQDLGVSWKHFCVSWVLCIERFNIFLSHFLLGNQENFWCNCMLITMLIYVLLLLEWIWKIQLIVIK